MTKPDLSTLMRMVALDRELARIEERERVIRAIKENEREQRQ